MKIINFDMVKKFSNRKSQKGILNYERTGYYRELLEVHLDILDNIFVNTEYMLRNNNLDPSMFSLVENSARNFISSDLYSFFEGKGSLGLSYEAVIKGIRYRTLAAAIVEGKKIELYFILAKWNGKEWLVRLDSGWSQVPELNFYGENQE